jgi:hypothetical protein
MFHADLNRFRNARMHGFIGNAIDVFHEYVRSAEKNFMGAKHYAKYMPIVQSSGAGKSRLVDEYGKRAVGIIFTLRRGQQGGYPPGDIEVTKFLHVKEGDRQQLPVHAMTISLLAAAIKQGRQFPFMSDTVADS